MIDGKNVTVGTKILTYEKVGTHYPTVVEKICTVTKIEPTNSPHADALMFLNNEKYPYFLSYSKQYRTPEQHTGRQWLEGDPNSPI